MAMIEKSGRGQLTLGPDSRLTKLFASYSEKVEEAFYQLMPDAMFGALFTYFERELTGEEDDSSFEKLSNEFYRKHSKFGKLLNPSFYADDPEGYARLEKEHMASDEIRGCCPL